VVRFGDTLFKIAQRYGTHHAGILRLNPGLDTARLVAGTQIQLVQAAPAAPGVLGLRPPPVAVLSWPDAPQFGKTVGPFDNRNASTWIWPTKGVFTSGYGWRWGRMHRGIDMANNVGTPIVAARTGGWCFPVGMTGAMAIS
jgi:murein DD-endopeptidase MepM/ murein hydrolase activator NlpD